MLEVTSRRTWQEDQGRKRELYRTLGVAEYWQYNPTGDYLQPRLQGLHLVAGEYRRMAARESAEDGLSISSSVLGLELWISERGLRFHDPATGEDVPSLAERREAWEREQQARERAERGWQRAEQGATARRARTAAGASGTAAGRSAAGGTRGAAPGAARPRFRSPGVKRLVRKCRPAGDAWVSIFIVVQVTA